MPVKIRLMRIGAKKRPFYRVVAVDERRKRTGQYLENLGTYNPLTEPKEIILKKDRIEYWVKNGAILSTGYLRIIGEAPQRPPRKPKKSAQGTGDSGQKKEAPTEEKPAEETATEAPESAPAEPETAEEAGATQTQETPGDAEEQTQEPKAESSPENTDEEQKA